jgi:hypothetical protein
MRKADSTNLILVPIALDSTNALSDATGKSLIVNKLDPCPDACLTEPGSFGKRNHPSDLNFDSIHNRWLKPNKGTEGRHWVDINDNVQ